MNQRKPLSPISRRAFLGKAVAGVGAVAALSMLAGGCPGGASNCGYCDNLGQDYEHCDGNYCDYGDYSDA